MINLTGLGSTSDKGASKWNSPAHAVQRRIRMQQIEWLIAYGGHTYSQSAGEYFFDWGAFPADAARPDGHGAAIGRLGTE